jgi:hypothetical protein
VIQNLNSTQLKIFTNSNLKNLIEEANLEIKKMLESHYYLASNSIALDNGNIASQLVFRKYSAKIKGLSEQTAAPEN